MKRGRREVKEGGEEREVKKGGEEREVKEGGEEREVKEGGMEREVMWQVLLITNMLDMQYLISFPSASHA